MATTNQAVQSNTVKGGYNQGFNSIYSAMLKPQVFGELIELYGKGLGIFDMLHFAGNTIDVKGHKQTVWSQGAIQRPISLKAAIAVNSAGDSIAINVTDAEYTGTKTFLTVGDAVFIPETYTGATANGPAKYQVMSKTGTAPASEVFTLQPYLDAYQIAVEVPIGTKLQVTGGNYAPGSQGASAKNRGWYSADYYTAIKRAAYHLEGSQQSDQRWQDEMINGEMGMFSKASAEADFLLTSHMNDELFLGEEPDNTSLTMANREGDDNTIYGTKGLWRHLVSDGGFQEYINNYEISDFDDVKDMFRSQGVINQAALFGVGSGLNRQLENSGLDFLKEFSGGTDLMTNLDEVGVNFRKIKKNSILYAIVELATFDNPQTYGLDSYDWKNRGFIVPNEFGSVKMGDSTESITLSNLTLGNKNYKGEDRTRVTGTLGGVNGMGYRFVDTWDDLRGELLAEFMLIAVKRNQMIRVQQA